MSIKYSKVSSKNTLDYDWKSLNYNRTALLNFIAANHPKGFKSNYLEIGCAGNINFNSIFLLNKTGVDPDIGGTLKLTSDEFFQDFNKEKYDLIFLDGLHTYKQTKKDLINALNALNLGGVIVLDDFIPRNWKEEFTPRVQSDWNGDVWKISFELLKSVGIKFKLITIDGGQCVIFKEKEKPFIPDFYEEFNNLKFDYFYNNVNKLPIINHIEGLDWIISNL